MPLRSWLWSAKCFRNLHVHSASFGTIFVQLLCMDFSKDPVRIVCKTSLRAHKLILFSGFLLKSAQEREHQPFGLFAGQSAWSIDQQNGFGEIEILGSGRQRVKRAIVEEPIKANNEPVRVTAKRIYTLTAMCFRAECGPPLEGAVFGSFESAPKLSTDQYKSVPTRRSSGRPFDESPSVQHEIYIYIMALFKKLFFKMTNKFPMSKRLQPRLASLLSLLPIDRH